MKNVLIYFAIAGLVACNTNAGNQPVPPPPSRQQTNQPLPQAQPQATPVNPQVTPVNTSQANQQPQTLPVTTGALNPKHGQPGHRCDIPEGAPLNSAPATPPQQNISMPQVNPATIQPTVVQQPVSGQGGVRLNPPHGQPGHDCGVEVGKPLKN